ncbi:SMI1/KNR4 family protein [Candidatus Pantoea multigeneris]|uniref:SMI1/KNR4 family protein n=1 Tax=Candidatus Pantoea multigeneris TaxID=2608357 RepID=A0ABX0RGF7_9GAMM|nr:SMI1/KNR4 family protein [Pantoea multigeneris]NIF24410.1 SMI1/KNR4 family protein [Pantoea multigeneris]
MPISCGKPLLGPEIHSLEMKYNTRLPDDYRKFLEKKNGFVVKSPDFSELHYDGVDEGIIAFHGLFGIETQNHYNDVYYHNDNFLNEVDFLKEKMIIGDDPGGNYFLIINIDNKTGVYYWDRTHLHSEDDIQIFAIPEKNDSGNIYKITDDFTSFYKMVLQTTADLGMKINNDL